MISGRALLGTLTVVGLLAGGCGRKGSLLYPDMLVPAPPSGITVQQSGSLLKVRFAVSDRDRAGRRLPGVAGVDVARRSYPTGADNGCPACPADYQLLYKLYFNRLPESTQFSGGSYTMVDPAVVSGQSYSYRLSAFTADGFDGAAAVTSGTAVSAPLAPPTLQLDAQPTEITLRASVHPGFQGRVVGYNVYRYNGTVRPFQPLNREPLPLGVYSDTMIERGKAYRYGATVVVEHSGVWIESELSVEREGRLKDDD